MRSGVLFLLLSFVGITSLSQAALAGRGPAAKVPVTTAAKTAAPVARANRAARPLGKAQAPIQKRAAAPVGARKDGAAPAKALSPFRKISERASVNRADSAVIQYLAEFRISRGPKDRRLKPTEARKAVAREWGIMDTQIISNTDPKDHPITGNATLVVKTERTGNGTIYQRVFGTGKYREFVVNIDTTGKAHVVGERSSAAGARFLRFLNEKLAVTRVVQDVLRSEGVRKVAGSLGLITLAVVLGQTGVSEFATLFSEAVKELAPAILAGASIYGYQGVSRRTEARLKAFEELTHELEKELVAGKAPVLEAVYERYKASLREVDIGTKTVRNVEPPSREQFVKALVAWELARGAH